MLQRLKAPESKVGDHGLDVEDGVLLHILSKVSLVDAYLRDSVDVL